jgi:MFS-type transporter involved in bile tolerance (Atg22 family)
MPRSISPLRKYHNEAPEMLRGQNENDESWHQNSTSNLLPQSKLKYIPRLFRFDNSTEATAVALDNCARAMILMASVFIGPALLQLAKEEAVSGCEDDDTECAETARVHGFLPSSILTNIATIAGLLSALILPLAGAIIDHTPHRRFIGLYSALGMSIIKGVEIGISSDTWFAMAWLQLVSAILFQLLTVTEYAYAAELSSQPQQQSKYQSYFVLCMFLSTIFFDLQVLIPAKAYKFDDIRTAKLGALLSALWSAPLFYLCWRYLFPSRQALHRVPSNHTLWSAGFVKLFQSYQTINSDFPAVRSFLLSAMFCEGANWSINTVAITYFSEFLQLSSQKIGLVIMLILIGGIPGTFIGKHVSLQYDPVTSAKASVGMFIIVICFASIFLSPATSDMVFGFGFFLGVCKGRLGKTWIHHYFKGSILYGQ